MKYWFDATSVMVQDELVAGTAFLRDGSVFTHTVRALDPDDFFDQDLLETPEIYARSLGSMPVLYRDLAHVIEQELREPPTEALEVEEREYPPGGLRFLRFRRFDQRGCSVCLSYDRAESDASIDKAVAAVKRALQVTSEVWKTRPTKLDVVAATGPSALFGQHLSIEGPSGAVPQIFVNLSSALHATEKSMFGTVVHELAHIAQRRLAQRDTDDGHDDAFYALLARIDPNLD